MNDQVSDERLPDVDQSGIARTGWLIYSTICTTREYKYGKAREYDNRPGREWTGSVNEVIAALWPAIRDASVIDRPTANDLKVRINRYLRNSRNVVCVHNGGVTKPSTWWISDHWASLVVTNGRVDLIEDRLGETEVEERTDDASVFDVQPADVTPSTPEVATAATVEHSEEEEMNIKDAEELPETFPCRYDECDRVLLGANYRAVHERSHGIRVNADGTVTMITQNEKRTDNDAVKTIITVVSALPDNMVSGEQLLELVRATDPLISAAQYRRAFNRLLDKPFNRYTLVKRIKTVDGSPRAHMVRYELVRQAATPQDVATATKRPESNLVSNTFNLIMAEKVGTANDAKTTVMTHATNLRLLIEDLERLDKVEEGLKASSAKNYELVERLRAVTRERDELLVEVEDLRNKLNVLRSVFGDALK